MPYLFGTCHFFHVVFYKVWEVSSKGFFAHPVGMSTSCSEGREKISHIKPNPNLDQKTPNPRQRLFEICVGKA